MNNSQNTKTDYRESERCYSRVVDLQITVTQTGNTAIIVFCRCCGAGVNPCVRMRLCTVTLYGGREGRHRRLLWLFTHR